MVRGGMRPVIEEEAAAGDAETKNVGAVPAKKRDPWSGVSTFLAMPKVVKAKKREVAFTKDWSESRLLTSPEFEAACQEEEKRREEEEAEKERKRVERAQKASEARQGLRKRKKMQRRQGKSERRGQRLQRQKRKRCSAKRPRNGNMMKHGMQIHGFCNGSSVEGRER
jgi:hypothetical protein